MIKKILIILFACVVSLSVFTSCKNNYAEEMFEILQQKNNNFMPLDSDKIPLGQYETCSVACFHIDHSGGGMIDLARQINIGEYILSLPCYSTLIYVYNKQTKELLSISDAYDAGWINDDTLLHIFYEFDQSLELFSGHELHKSEDFVWDLEGYKK